MNRVRRLMRDESGATMVEYALALALLFVFSFVSFTLIDGRANNQYNSSTTTITTMEESPLPT